MERMLALKRRYVSSERVCKHGEDVSIEEKVCKQ